MNIINTTDGIFHLQYASYHDRGIPVVPIEPNQKGTFVPQWSRWSYEPQLIETLDDLAKTHTNHGIGIVCGPQSAVIGFDIDLDLSDPKHQTLFQAIEPHIPSSPVSKTGKKGFTRFFKFNGEISKSLKCGKQQVIDILSSGRQSVLPPSRHPCGDTYHWRGGESLLDIDVKNLPILPSENLMKIETILREMAHLFEGSSLSSGRNETLKSQVVAAMHKGKSDTEIVSEVLRFDFANHSPPLFSDKSELQMKSHAPSENALRFVANIRKSLGMTDVNLLISTPIEFDVEKKRERPVLADDAYHGLAGEIVRSVDPYTEADPAAVLIQLVTLVVKVVGRKPHWWAGATAHYLNEYIMLVGSTAKGRKGTSTSLVTYILSKIEPEFCQKNFATGLGSGEGLTYRVRDRKEGVDPKTKESVVVDEGISDKRLVVVEEEFANVFAVTGRDGNTLAGNLRSAWDGKSLESIVKNNPMRATEPYISLIAHITPKEFLQRMGESDLYNGNLNRYLFVNSVMSKKLPLGGKIPDTILEPFYPRLKEVIRFASNVDSMGFTQDAEFVWQRIYDSAYDSSDDDDISAITARSLPIMRRIACNFALFDLSSTVDVPHLKAAAAIAEYSEATCRLLLNHKKSLLTPIQEKILNALSNKADGLSKTALLKDVFKGNAVASDLNLHLAALQKLGMIFRTSDRPEVWIDKSQVRVPPHNDCTNLLPNSELKVPHELS